MAFITGTATDQMDMLDQLAQIASASNVNSVAVNAGGSNYVVGDIITISGGTFTHVATFEVRSVFSEAVSATVAAAGTGYLVNDQLTLVGGTGVGVAAVFNVDSVGGSGEVTGVSLVTAGDYQTTPGDPVSTTGGAGTGATLNVTWTDGIVSSTRMVQNGAYSVFPSDPASTTGGSGSGLTVDLTTSATGWTVLRETQEAVSATVATAGSGYLVNDKLTVVGGVEVETAAIFNVDTVGGSGEVTAVSLDTAGKYGVVPANPVSTTGGAGSGAELTVTWQGFTGSSLDKDYILEGVGGGTEEIFVGIRSYTSGSAHNWELRGFTGHASGSAFNNQPGISPGNHAASEQGAYVPLNNSTLTFWVMVDSFAMRGVFKMGSSYTNFYLGFGDRFGTADEYPYPLVVEGCSSVFNLVFSSSNIGFSGLTDPIAGQSHTIGPGIIRDPGGNWRTFKNGTQASSNQRATADDVVVFPSGQVDWDGSDSFNRPGNGTWIVSDFIPTSGNPGTAVLDILQTPDAPDFQSPLWQATLVEDTPNIEVLVQLRGIFWISSRGEATAIVSEDTIDDGTDVWLVFQNCLRTAQFAFVALKRE